MLVTAYNFTLNHSLPQGLVTIGRFDGKTPSLASSTTGGKILVHTPHTKDAVDPSVGMKGRDVQYLNVNKDVICLTSGRLNPHIDRDILLIGSKTNLLAYDINENSDVFDKEVQDGINCMIFAQDLNPDFPMVVTGGNLSLTGFDISSEEQFWTVTGDVANAMIVLDFDLDQQKELIVGSDDYSIRVYKNEEMIFDINEDSKVQFLSKIEKASFAYALSNGTLGVYSGTAQKWKQRVDNRISALLGVDFDMDGSRQIMIGYQSGKFEVRKATDGTVTYKANMGATVSKIMYEDYRMEGAPQVVVCNSDGDIKGYNISTNVDAFEVKTTTQKKESEAINKMNLEIHKLKAELDEENKEKRDADSATLAMNVPHDIKVAITQSTLSDSACIIFKVQSPLVIRSVILFSDKLFEEGTFVSCPGKASNTITIPIVSEKNIECEIDCKILVGKSLSSEDFMTVHETVT